jgi:hypothetical protein
MPPRNFVTSIPAAASVDEASVYRLLRAHDLINSPAFIVMKAANEFKLSRMYQTGTLYIDGRLHLPASRRVEETTTLSPNKGRSDNDVQ